MNRTFEDVRRKIAWMLYRYGISVPPVLPAGDPEVEREPGVSAFVFRFYPYHFIRAEEIRPQFTFRADGVPVRYHKDLRDYFNLLYPAYWGLIHANQYQETGASSAVQVMLHMADTLVTHGRNTEDKLFFDYTVDHPAVFLAAPWVSGLTQALAVSLFVRAHQISSDAGYATAALRAARVLITEVSQGGVWYEKEHGQAWIEEYPGDPPTHVLNGCLFGLIALTEILHIDIAAFSSYQQTLLDSVVRMYPQYRIGSYLLYDLRRKQFCNAHYMGLHTLLCYHLRESTGYQWFRKTADELASGTNWRAYARSVNHPFGHTMQEETQRMFSLP